MSLFHRHQKPDNRIVHVERVVILRVADVEHMNWSGYAPVHPGEIAPAGCDVAYTVDVVGVDGAGKHWSVLHAFTCARRECALEVARDFAAGVVKIEDRSV